MHFSARTLGLLDTVLKKHLQMVSSFYVKEKDRILYNDKQIQQDLKQRFSAKRQAYRDQKSVGFRNEGNVLFKKGDYQNARVFYTRSLAEAIKGELAALAYSNRFAYLMIF